MDSRTATIPCYEKGSATNHMSIQVVARRNANSTIECNSSLSVSDWGGAEFLGGALLRTEVVLAHDAVVTRARAYVAAPGCHALEVNGRRPPEDLRGICPFMAPGVGQGGNQLYSSRIVYQTHNVTRLICMANFYMLLLLQL